MKDIITDYYYVFKFHYKKKIEEEYKTSDQKINYTNIRLYDEKYSSFITILLWLINEVYNDKKVTDEIKYFLESKNLMDRLKGLKLSRKCIKLEMI